ncbi:MAG TPA: Nif3-like dinuclear metal center hexameric protein, partial [Mycobacterium sp.]|nr:Nif3-like dinuclear metal center hexameric protein [Mycobacterium sp.]HUO38115.1 Nif3-like dinuclear metal center hexameric protein [Mycobacterium sp.]
MSVRLADVIEVLDEAYPPRLAQPWDSVGLVCGDPDDAVDSVTVAVDATPAVVDQVPEAGLLLAHHPLLLRGVDTVAASTPKGALVHRLIRTGRSLFTAHTNADSASPGVSDALAEALDLTVEAPLEPASGATDLDKWVVYVPRENAAAVQDAVFEAGA